MKTSADKSKRYLKLIWLYLKVNFLRALEYRVDFFTSLFPAGFYFLSYILFINAIFGKVPIISGWSFDRLLVLFSVSQLSYYSAWFFYRDGLRSFSESINTGGFDSLVKLPINTRFVTSFREQSLNMVIPLLLAIVTFLYALGKIRWNFASLGVFAILFLCGLIILYNFLFILASLSFWIIEGEELMNLSEEIIAFGRYPKEIFPTGMALFLLIIVPALLMVYVPATALLGILDWKLALVSILMVFVTYFISEFVWQKGLLKYSTASS